MFTESRRIHLIEEVLKEKNEQTLQELESVLSKSKHSKEKKVSAHDFVGLWSRKDASLIEKAIKEGCEQIDTDGWK